MPDEVKDLQAQPGVAPETGSPENVETLPPATNAEGSAQEPLAQETGSAEGSDPANQPAKAPDVPKGWKWNGDVNALPEEFKERGRGMLRHFTDESEKLAEQRRQLDSNSKQSEEIAQLRKAQEPPVQPPVDPNEQYLSREFQDAVESGDSAKMMEAQNKIIDYRLQKQLQAIEPTYRKIVEDSQRASAEVKNSMILKDFGEKNPRFWTHKNSKLAPYIVREICDKQGKSLNEAQKLMDEIANYYQNEARRSLNQTVQEQKRAVSVTPTTPMETKYVYVNSSKEADRMNIEFSMDGSDKIAVIKK